MAEWYYTDLAREKQGPVSEEALLEQNESGELRATSLVWREGMADWLPFSEMAGELFGESDEGNPIETGVCAHSKRVFPLADLVPYGGALVSAKYKDQFVQELMEGSHHDVQDFSDRVLEYVGFWFRVLSSILDYLIKLIPGQLIMVPYYIAGFSSAAKGGSESPFGGETIIVVTYLFGIVGVFALDIFYETWMVGKWGGTAGKLIIGARVVNPDGSKLTYKRAFVRWLGKRLLVGVIISIPPVVVMILFFGVGFATMMGSGDNPAIGLASMSVGLVVCGLVYLVCLGVYWMCAFDAEKRTLHDRVCSTRVVKA